MTTFLLIGVLPIAGAWLLVELHRAACRFVDNAVAAAIDTSRDDRVAEAVALCEPDPSTWLIISAAINGADFDKWTTELKEGA